MPASKIRNPIPAAAAPVPKQITIHENLYTALAAAQGEMPNAIFNCVNPHFKNRYADLSAIREATLPALSKHGLAINHRLVLREGFLLLVARLTHGVSGQFDEAEWPITGSTPQAKGSDMTYGRRYTWSCLTGIASEEDDDAEAAEYAAKKGIKLDPNAKQKSAYRARKDGDWQTIQAEMNAIDNAHELKMWAVNNSERLHSLPDNWLTHFREAYEARITMLQEGVTEEGKPTLKEQLKATLNGDEIPESGGGSVQ